MMMNGGIGGFSIFFGLMMLFAFAVFALVIGLVIYTIVKNAKQSRYNHAQPVLSVSAKIVSTRTDVHRSTSSGDAATGMSGSSSAYTRYYATFEVKSGDRMEFLIPDNVIGYLVQGDVGELTFQGTEFKSFVRVQ